MKLSTDRASLDDDRRTQGDPELRDPVAAWEIGEG